MSTNRPQQATIETSVEGILDAVLEAGFEPGRRVRVQVEYIEEDGDMPPGFVLIESGDKRTLSGVTLETMPQAMRKLGIGPDETFSIIVRSEAGAEMRKSRMDRLLAMKGAGARLHGARSVEEIDAEIREFRGEG